MPKVNTVKRERVWQYYFETAKINGKRTRMQKCGFATKKEAEAAGIKALSEYNNFGQPFEVSDISFSDYIDMWLQQYASINFKPETIKNYTKKINNHLKPVFGKYRLQNLTPAVLQTFINNKFNEGYSRNTLATMKGILSKALLYAVEPLGLLQHSPMVYVKLPSPRAKAKIKTRSKEHIYIEREKAQKIFERFPETTSTHIPMMFAYRCGTRPSECFAFVWEDIDLDNAILSVNRQVQWDENEKRWYFTEPKYDSFRTVEIDKNFVELLKREKERQQLRIESCGEFYNRLYENDKRQINSEGEGNEIHLVCVRPNGDFITPRTMQHTSHIIHHKMEMPEFDMHSFRITHATMLAENGAPPKYVQKRLGHKNIQITLDIYTKLSDTVSSQGKAILNTIFKKEEPSC